MDKVLLGMSGGVDSSVSAILLQEKGYEVIGVTMKLWEAEEEVEGGCCNLSSTYDAKRVCDKLGISHYVINLKEEFKKYVIDDFVEKYEKCLTPNPCIKCNKYMKFDLMYKKAKELGCKYIATGHYAKTEYSEKYGKYVLKKSRSQKKDQTYVLYNIPSDMVENVLFPLGDFESKDEIRKIAKDHGLNVASKPDSQEICFIPDNDYVSFLNNHMKCKHDGGNIVDKTGKVLGIHEGLYRYTIGQRKGMGISSKTPLYVTKLDDKKNELVVGMQDDIFSDEVRVDNINCILFDKFTSNMRVKAKIRYSAEAKDATIFLNDDNTLTVKFDEKVRAVTPGQSIVFYIDDIVVGGGEIMRS